MSTRRKPVLTVFDQFRIIDAVWMGSTVIDAFEECGLDYRKVWPFIDPDFGSFLIEVDMVARARDKGLGIIPGQGFVS